jgi:Chloride channel protein EriC
MATRFHPHPPSVRPAHLIGKVGLGLMGMLGGLTLGREGPTVHVGASIMYEMRRFYPRVSLRMERMLLLAGSAAGLSGAFNTPLAGILFAIEELTRSFEVRTNGVLITSIVFSGLVSLALAGNYLYFGQISAPDIFPLAFVLPVVIAAVLCGLAGRRSICPCSNRCGGFLPSCWSGANARRWRGARGWGCWWPSSASPRPGRPGAAATTRRGIC